MKASLAACAAAVALIGCVQAGATQAGTSEGGVTAPVEGTQGPAHVANWLYACSDASGTCTQPDNVGIPASWMAAHADWNEVYYNAADDRTSQQLAAAGAKHIVVYLDPNISAYCPVPQGSNASAPDFPENGANCASAVATYLHAENGSYAHAYEHQANGNRLFDHADGFYGGQAQEPFAIGDQDLQAAFHTASSQDPYATEVFEDDGGGSYNCIFDQNDLCGGTYGPAHDAPPACDYTGGYWCYKYGETAVEWDAAANPQQAYENDAVALAHASAHPVIGNDGVATDAYDMSWLRDARVEGAMSENTWGPVTTASAWIEKADAILTYHLAGKYVVEEDTDEARLMFEIASHWIVYDPHTSIEFLAEVNPAAHSAGGGDMTFPEQTIVPTDPLIATPPSADVTVFQVAPGVFVREFGTCYENGAPAGACAAVVNASASATPLVGLTRSYTRALAHDTARTWAAGGTPQFVAVPASLAAGAGIILLQ